jgi:predicted AlkP superfamily phosphohydrolase/phosphomutase
MPQTPRRVLIIALDAADPELIERWTGDGTLPHLDALRRRGVAGRLSSSAHYLAGSPWPTFATGRPPSHHGLYHDFQWRHETMSFATPRADWLPIVPFWRHLVPDVPVVAYDVPMTLSVEPFNGCEISGWAAHDKLARPASYPGELLPEIQRRFGEWHIGPEQFGPSAVDELLQLAEQLRDGINHSADLALWLLERPWRLAIVAFGALHRGGHRLFDRSSIAGLVTDAQGERFDRSLRDLYVACDAAVGRLTAAAPDATVIVFSAHGMMANISRVDLLDDMLARVLTGRSDTRPRRGVLRRLVEVFPLEWRRAVTSRVPRKFRDRLMTMWSAGGIAWERTPAFTLRADLQGYVRVNLLGREQRGIVAPGAALEDLCTRITEGLLSFRDSQSGEPLVAAVERIERLYPDGDRRDRLPDLVVQWSDAPAGPHVAVDSPQLGRVVRSTPGRIPNGRSGNHRGEGFIIASGPGIPAGLRLGSGISILDLAPTVVRMLGAHSAGPLGGRAIPELVGAA